MVRDTLRYVLAKIDLKGYREHLALAGKREQNIAPSVREPS